MGIKLRTDWELDPGQPSIDHHSKIMLVGSCFSENISNRLKSVGFDILENPHGIVFHPLAIERSISDCILERTYSREELVFNGETWSSLHHHGRFNHTGPEAVLDSIHSELRHAHKFLKRATHLVLTLGTSWAYRHRAKDCYVANCHKIPQKEFEKVLLDPEEILMSLERIISQVKQVNPSIAFVLTVSPVRHVRDGMVENTLSKARLHEAIHQLLSRLEGVSYFPAYEIVMDDLRDYRFYQSDLVHPNEIAVEYIWEKFVEAWIAPKARDLMKRAESIHRALMHRPIQVASEKHLSFRQNIQEEIRELKANHPEVKIYEHS